MAAAELTKQVQKSVELTQAIAAAGTRQSAASQTLARATAPKNAAPGAAATARSTAKAATLAVHSARDAFNHADQDRASGEKALVAARTALQAATTSLTAVKKEHAQAAAAKAGAEKALAEKRAALDCRPGQGAGHESRDRRLDHRKETQQQKRRACVPRHRSRKVNYNNLLHSSRLDGRRRRQSQVADRLVAKNVLADLSRDRPRQRLDDHDVLRNFEMGDLALAILLQFLRLHARARS